MIFSQWEEAKHGRLLGWTIYSPECEDYPGFYVARAWVAICHGGAVPEWPYSIPSEDGSAAYAYVGCLCQSLREARQCVGPEFTFLGRQPDDLPQIIESWI